MFFFHKSLNEQQIECIQKTIRRFIFASEAICQERPSSIDSESFRNLCFWRSSQVKIKSAHEQVARQVVKWLSCQESTGTYFCNVFSSAKDSDVPPIFNKQFVS